MERLGMASLRSKENIRYLVFAICLAGGVAWFIPFYLLSKMKGGTRDEEK
jgi:hypothetical protein